MKQSLNRLISSLNEDYSGDITFIQPISADSVKIAEEELNCTLPKIFKYFYQTQSNGLHIDNKRIYSISDRSQKKTLTDNLQRNNTPKTSYWFKFKPEIFTDFIVIGSDVEICFAISKHKNIENPSIFICENPNTTGEVILEELGFGLEELIKIMVQNAFE